MTERDKGQIYVLELLDKIAAEQGLKLASDKTRWWTPTKLRLHAYYDLEVSTATGKTTYQHFSPGELGGCRSDEALKEAVKVKVKNIVFRLVSEGDVNIQI
jgi:hypothetical protein